MEGASSAWSFSLCFLKTGEGEPKRSKERETDEARKKRKMQTVEER